MPKPERPAFYCKNCGNEYPRWEGKCRACGEWDTVIEAPAELRSRPRGGKRSGGGERESRARAGFSTGVRPLREFAKDTLPRIRAPLGEFHRVLGGGIVPGGSVLLGGEPGIGKSTLLLQLLAGLAADEPAGSGAPIRSCLYISGEESPAQIAARGLRLAEAEETATAAARAAYASDLLKLSGETDLYAILELLEAERPRVAVVDSVQTLRDPAIPSAPGTVNQIRECTLALVDRARRTDTALFLIGHVTKDGTLAGPRVLEHIVDTVLSFEGDRRLGLRALRAIKNRFGSAHEVGLFEMSGRGLVEVPDPAAVLLDREAALEAGPGTTVGALVEGTRVLLLEIQALTVPVFSGGSPRRRAAGLDANRLAMLLAVLETKAGVPFGNLDVFVSAVGGFEVDEPAADLPLALALASVATGRQVRRNLAAAGEVGLGGELRSIGWLEARVAEARRLNFSALLLPERGRTAAGSSAGLKLLRAKNLREALALGLE